MRFRQNHQKYQQNPAKNQIKRFLVLAGLLVIVSGVFSLVYAYFTGVSVAQALTLQTANLAIEATDPSADNQPLLPGETQFATWEIKNTGNVSQHFKFKLEKTLIEEGEVDSLKIISLSYEQAGSWTEWLSDDRGLTGEVFWSDRGDNTDLKTLPAGDSVKLKVGYRLDADTPSQMQNKSWQIKLHAAAKQTQLTADWPSSY